ncbi:MAG: prolyl oligopeptidase family serine peptidase [Pseudomonadota bacterium]
MKALWTNALAAVLMSVAAHPAAAICANDRDAPCEIDLGTYHIALPDGARGPIPAVMFLHGAGGRGVGVIRNIDVASAFLDRGYAVIGPNGLDRPGRLGRGWSFLPSRPQQRDELAFFTAVRDDAAARFNIDPDAVILAGFSIGGSMTSYIACDAPDEFAAYAPVAGSFWRPIPEDCAGPVRLLHTHGWRDQTVPLEGRPLGGGQVYQGDVWQSMQTWRRANGCDDLRANSFDTEGGYWRRVWEDCADGTALEFALHRGAHGVPDDWSAMMLDWYEGLAD